jgi:copper(I)-binding protein
MRLALFAAFLTPALTIASAAAAASVAVSGAWIRTPPPGAPTAAAYATIVNHGVSSDRLMGAHSAAAASVAPHRMSMAGGIMRMRPVTGGMPIGASGTISLTPNGDHLMLTGLKAPLKAGQHVRIVLEFQRAGSVAADFVVRDDAGAMGGMRM